MSLCATPEDVKVVIYRFLQPRGWYRSDEIKDAAAVAGVCKDAHGMMAKYLNGCLQMAFVNLKARDAYYREQARAASLRHQVEMDDVVDELEHVFDRTPAAEVLSLVLLSVPPVAHGAAEPAFLRQLNGASVRDLVHCFVVWCDDISKNATAAQIESADRAVALPPAL
jgi:hypothetical protein